MTKVFALALPFFGLILLGFLAAKLSRNTARSSDWLNVFVVNFTVPALLYLLLARAPFEELDNRNFILGTTAATFIVFTVAVLTFSLFSRAKLAVSAIRGAAAGYGNVGYMGVPLAVGAFGAKAAVPATLIVCFDSLLIFILVPILVAIGMPGRAGLAQAGVDIFRRIFLNPIILACFLGIATAWVGVLPPAPVLRILEYLSQAAAPCALFALGVTVASRPLRQVPRELPWIMMLKLVIHPLVVLLVLGTAGVDELWLKTAILLSGLPPALGVYVLANQYDVYVERASSAILIGTLVSIATVTVLLYMIEAGLIATVTDQIFWLYAPVSK